MSLRNNRVVAITAGAAIIVAASSFGAVAAKLVTSADIKDQTIKKIDIKKGGVGGSEVKDKSLKVKDLSDGAQKKLKGNTGPAGPAGPPGAAAATTMNNLNGAFRATNATVSITPDGVEFGPYANGGVDSGSVCYGGLNGRPLSAVRNLVYHARYAATNDTGGVGVPYLRVFTGNADANSSIFSPNDSGAQTGHRGGPVPRVGGDDWGAGASTDDAGNAPDITFAQLIAAHGAE